jgi:hypothetical protein
MRCWPSQRGLRVLIAPLLLAAGLSKLVPGAAFAAAAGGSSTPIRRLVVAGLAALAAAGIGIAVMSGSGVVSVRPHAQIVSQGVPIAPGPTLGPPG